MMPRCKYGYFTGCGTGSCNLLIAVCTTLRASGVRAGNGLAARPPLPPRINAQLSQ